MTVTRRPPLHAVSSGEGEQRVVLVHGAMDDGASFDGVAAALPDLHVLRYDRRGYGASRYTGDAPGLTGHVDDLVSLLGGRPAVAIGHSVGGAIVVLAALAHPECFTSIGVYEMPMGWAPWWPSDTAASQAVAAAEVGGAGAAGEAFARRMWGERRWATLTPEAQEARRAHGAAFLAESADLRRASSFADLGSLRVPLRVATGGRSRPYQRQAAAELTRLVPGAVLDELDGVGHGAHATHPATFAAWARSVMKYRLVL